MNCADAKHLIHLDVGDDLRSEEELQLAGHMEGCAECRSYHSGMSGAMSALLLLRESPETEPRQPSAGFSVWPSVSREIERRRTTPAASRKFNLQVAALSVCSLSLAVVTIVQSLSAMRASSDVPVITPAMSVSWESDPPQLSGSRQFTSDDSRSEFVLYFPQTSPDAGPQSF